MAEQMKHDIRSKNVVPKTVLAPANAPLAFSRFDTDKFLDFVPPAAVHRVFHQDRQEFVERFQERSVSLGRLPELSLKRRSRENSKVASHLSDSLLGFGGRTAESGEE